MELRSTEKEISSLTDLYQNVYNTAVTSVYFDQSNVSTPANYSGNHLQAQAYTTLIMRDYLPSWEEIVLDSTATNTTTSATNKPNDVDLDTTTTSSGSSNTTCCIPKPSNSILEEMNSMTLKDTVKTVSSFQERIQQLLPKINKFQKRMKETDPITQTPRYGEKTMTRVQSVIQLYTSLQYALEKMTLPTPTPLEHNSSTTNPNPPESPLLPSSSSPNLALLPFLEKLSKEEDEYIQHQTQQLQMEKLSKEKRQQMEEMTHQQQLEHEQKIQQQLQQQKNEELARKAQAVRLAKEQQLEREREARKQLLLQDQQFMDSIEKGIHGVQIQLARLYELVQSNYRTEYRIAIESLTTIFQQIVSEPDNEMIRKIKRDHVRFHQDIGRHPGGCEFLIASGFRLVRIQTEEHEDTPVFLLKEPNIETDMDGWADWFDMLKATLKELEDAKAKL